MGHLPAVRRLVFVVAAAGIPMFDVAPARADGVPRVATLGAGRIADWRGYYVGGQLGGAWSDVDWTQNANYFNTLGPIIVGTDSSFSPSGVLGGVFGGGNLQLGQWIFGAELSATATDLSSTQASPFFPATDTFTTELNWLATAEGRIGYSWDRTMVFGKAGWAGGGVSLALNDNGAGISASKDTWANGWTVGGGAEYAMRDGFILGLEYDYTTLNVSGAALNCPLCGTGVGLGSPVIDSDIKISSVMARLSYLFRLQD